MSEQRLFISHASEDEAVANRIVAYLESHGVPCWISSRDIPPRAIYADAIAEGMQACSACAVIASAAANASKAVKRELELASHEDKPFIPIRIETAEPVAGLAYYLRNIQWTEYERDRNKALDRIIAHLAADQGKSQTSATIPASTQPVEDWILGTWELTTDKGPCSGSPWRFRVQDGQIFWDITSGKGWIAGSPDPLQKYDQSTMGFSWSKFRRVGPMTMSAGTGKPAYCALRRLR